MLKINIKLWTIKWKELSFNNINDLHGCLEIMREFKDSKNVVCVAVKHTNPCGVGIANNSFNAYKNVMRLTRFQYLEEL